MENEKMLSAKEIDRVIEMAWEDRTPFEAIAFQFGLPEKEVIALMRRELKRSGFNRWRKRTHGRSTKHAALKHREVTRFKCSRQRQITMNKYNKK